MSPTAPEMFRAVFGSETRAKLLGSLADSREPQTGYSLAKRIDVSPSKVYKQLPRLLDTGIIDVQQDESGYKRYFLTDEDLRKFLRKRVRVTSAEQWFSPERTRQKRDAYELLQQLDVDLPRTRPEREAISNPEEFERPPEKDRILRRLRR